MKGVPSVFANCRTDSKPSTNFTESKNIIGLPYSIKTSHEANAQEIRQ